MIVNLVRNIGSELETFTTLDLADFGELENMMIATGSFRFQDLRHFTKTMNVKFLIDF